MKKKSFTILAVIAILCVIFIVGSNYINREEDSQPSVDQLVEQYDIVVNMIKDNKLSVKANGLVVLPDELKHLSDSGECFITEFRGETAIYFYLFRGIIDSSRGYVYVTDDLSYENYINTERFVASKDFTKTEKIKENLFLCSTG